MSYNCYLFGELMPVTPAKLTVKVKGANKTVTTLNEGEINILKSPNLSEISLSLIFPMFSARQQPSYYLRLFETAVASKKPTRFVLTRSSPTGLPLFDTSMAVSIEEYTIAEKAENGFDVTVDVKLKQYRSYGSASLVVVNAADETAVITAERETTSVPAVTEYTVKYGDTLWGIAKRIYGDGMNYTVIYEANTDILPNPNTLYVGQRLKIPQ